MAQLDKDSLWKNFHDLYEMHKPQYHFNILNELQGHIVENSHTNILMKLLEYEEEGDYPFLDSFCKKMMLWNNKIEGKVNFEVEKSVKNEESKKGGRMDGFISQTDKFAIIIENKINDAPDQKNQLSRYVNHAIKEGNFDQEKIWIMYLTKSGSDPSFKECNSLKDLGYNCSFENKNSYRIDDERFFAISYVDDILPWLKDDVLPNIRIGDISLWTGVSQYVDYIERMFCGNDISDKIKKETIELIDQYLQGIEGYQRRTKALHKFFEKKFKKDKDYAEINTFLNIVEDYQRKPTRLFAELTKAFFTEKCGAQCFVKSHFENYYMNIFCSKWGKDVYFSWCPNPLSKLVNPNAKLTFSINCRKQGIMESFKKHLAKYICEPDIQDKKDKYEHAQRASTAWRRSVPMKGFCIININESKKTRLNDIYEQLVCPELIEAINGIFRQ